MKEAFVRVLCYDGAEPSRLPNPHKIGDASSASVQWRERGGSDCERFAMEGWGESSWRRHPQGLVLVVQTSAPIEIVLMQARPMCKGKGNARYGGQGPFVVNRERTGVCSLGVSDGDKALIISLNAFRKGPSRLLTSRQEPRQESST